MKISNENMISFLLTTPMFENLEPREIMEVIHTVEVQKHEAGEMIFREGDPGDAWYALYKGEVDVLKQKESGEKLINTLGPHACFGEMAVLDGMPRSASIRATKESVTLRVPQKVFNDLLAQNSLVAYKLARNMAIILAERQRSTTESLSTLLKSDNLAAVQQGIGKIVGESSTRE